MAQIWARTINESVPREKNCNHQKLLIQPSTPGPDRSLIIFSAKRTCRFRKLYPALSRIVNHRIIDGDVFDAARARNDAADLFKSRSRLEAENLFLPHLPCRRAMQKFLPIIRRFLAAVWFGCN